MSLPVDALAERHVIPFETKACSICRSTWTGVVSKHEPWCEQIAALQKAIREIVVEARLQHVECRKINDECHCQTLDKKIHDIVYGASS